jgi:hypothetical protein
MTDNPPVAAAGPLPPLLLNSSIADVELGYILDAAGKKVEPARFECSQIRGLTMRRLPMLQLRAFCMSMGISLPDDATQASLLEALATKKMDSLAQAPPPWQEKDSSDDEEEEIVSKTSNQSKTSTQSNQSSILSTGELVKRATLVDVVIVPEMDKDGILVTDEHGTQVMIATTIAAIAIKSIKVDILRTFCIKYGLKPQKKSKDILAREIAYSKQMEGVLQLTDVASKQSSQQRLAMKIRLLNVCFTDLHYVDFLNVNKKKTRAELDRGDAGNSKHFYVSITDMANDSQNDDLVGQSSFPDDEHLSEAMTEGLDLKSFVVTTWTQGKKLLAEVFKEHQLANGKFTKSGSHEKDFFGDGFTKDLAAYYFYLLLQDKPEANKGVSTMLDEGVFHVAGDLKRPAAALEKKKKKAARQSEANLQGAKDVMQPLMASLEKTQSDREERRAKAQSDRDARLQTHQESQDALSAYIQMGEKIDSMVIAMSKETPDGVVFNHLKTRIKESEEDRQTLKLKSGKFVV